MNFIDRLLGTCARLLKSRFREDKLLETLSIEEIERRRAHIPRGIRVEDQEAAIAFHGEGRVLRRCEDFPGFPVDDEDDFATGPASDALFEGHVMIGEVRRGGFPVKIAKECAVLPRLRMFFPLELRLRSRLRKFHRILRERLVETGTCECHADDEEEMYHARIVSWYDFRMKLFLLITAGIIPLYGIFILFLFLSPSNGGPNGERGMGIGIGLIYGGAIAIALIALAAVALIVRAFFSSHPQGLQITTGIITGILVIAGIIWYLRPSENERYVAMLEKNLQEKTAKNNLTEIARAISDLLLHSPENGQAAFAKVDQRKVFQIILAHQGAGFGGFAAADLVPALEARYPEELKTLSAYKLYQYRVTMHAESPYETRPAIADVYPLFHAGYDFDPKNEATLAKFLEEARALDRDQGKFCTVLFQTLIHQGLFSEFSPEAEELTKLRESARFLRKNGFRFSETEAADEDLRAKLAEVELTDLL